jgi:hypothetical protein
MTALLASTHVRHSRFPLGIGTQWLTNARSTHGYTLLFCLFIGLTFFLQHFKRSSPRKLQGLKLCKWYNLCNLLPITKMVRERFLGAVEYFETLLLWLHYFKIVVLEFNCNGVLWSKNLEKNSVFFFLQNGGWKMCL